MAQGHNKNAFLTIFCYFEPTISQNWFLSFKTPQNASELGGIYGLPDLVLGEI